jgi:hypothetical protein
MNSLRRRPIDLAGVLPVAFDVDAEDDDEYIVRKKTALAINSQRNDARSNEKKMLSRRLISRRARISGLICMFASSLWIVSVLVRNYTPPQHGQHRQQRWITHDRSVLQLLLSSFRNRDSFDRNSKHSAMIPTTVVFSCRTRRSSWRLVQMPLDDLISSANSDAPSIDYGNLTVSPSSFSSFDRSISEQDYKNYEMIRNQSLQAMNAVKPNLPPKLWHVDELWTAATPRQCYPNNWGLTNAKPVCNSLHEIRMMDRPYSPREVDQELDIQYKASGYFRDVWIMDRPDPRQHVLSSTTSATSASPTTAVLKKYQLQDYFPLAEHALYQVQKEAIILEHLSASDRIIDEYYGISSLIEAAEGDVVAEMVPTSGYIQQNDLDRMQMDDVKPMNNLTLAEKLDMALVMAESLADIHGYKGGVIAHGDVHPEQWLRTLDGKLKLNDFGSGEILDFDPWNQIYCNVYRCYSGCYHAPEELKCVRGNEAFDIYSIGNNMYVLLTGLWPYYSEPEFDERAVARKVKFGIRPYLDERYRHRSFVERRLVQIMEECWEIDFEKRVSIFEVVRQLADLKTWHAGERPHVQSQ